MKLRFGLRARFIVIFLLFSILISAVAGYITRKKYEETIWNQYQESAIEIAGLAASCIDGDKFEQYAATLEKDDAYQATQDMLNRIRRSTDVEYLYALQVISDSETIYVFDTWTDETPAEDIGQLGGREAYNPDYTGIADALETGQVNSEFEVTEITQFGYNASIYAPVINSSGEAVGVVGVDMAMNDIRTASAKAVRDLLSFMVLIIAVCFLLLLLVVQNEFITPVRVLKSCVQEMADGRLGVQAPVRGNNEISEISTIFNQMSFNISSHMREITDLNDGYHKFVPLEIFKILQKQEVSQIRLGDYRETVLSVMSMQINDFEHVTGHMAPMELFAFINRIYREAVPDVQSRGGVIGEYYGGGFTAFYQNGCRQVLDSAIVICQRFHEVRRKLEQEGGVMPYLGFGISFGPVMLGIVGDKDRLSASMLSEQITAAEHLKRAAWKYRASILITGTAAAQIPEFETRYSSRLIGLLHLRTSDRAEKIYDVYDGDAMEDRERKDLTKEKFEEGVRRFLAREFYEARLCFIEVLKLYRFDYAAREYLYLCNSFYQNEEGAREADVYVEEC